ncbi:MAG: 2-oxoacid:acceptor oxidoreductase subunit alpha [Candidatus Omnitrophica bacterium]|nr:2-oxoacid:acceptor oxidoreductase subunit alpha [Candidatus Omnitrophota bacterium]
MLKVDLTIKIAGEAGQGLQTMGQLLSRAFAHQGFFVFSNQVIQSRIRGGHNWFQVRVCSERVLAPASTTDILVALDKESSCHLKELTKNSIIIFDSSLFKMADSFAIGLDIPLGRIASENGGNRIMSNTVAVGAILGLLEFDMDVLSGLIKESFGEKDMQVADVNIKIARAGYDLAYRKVPCNRLPQIKEKTGQPKMFVGGSESVALGALAAGCQFISAYPMSPSTGIMTYLASKQDKCHVVVEQSEDEIASINIALGAAFAGVRAMTASAGGGFALMVEGLSLAGMTETPVVIVVAQRPAPATGLPTRTAQEDLEFVIHAGHGEFPRLVVAPATIEDAFYETARAFNIAEKYRIPVLILSDQFIADSAVTIDDLDFNKVNIERSLMSEEELKTVKDYKSCLITRSGVSPRALPGNPYCFVTADSDEHDETGRITEDVDFMRPEMVKKRNRKNLGLLKEARPPKWYGPRDAKNVLIGWGSTFGPLREAIDLLNAEKEKTALVHFTDVWPLNEKHFGFLKKVKFAAVAENNFTAQFARLITRTTGIVIKNTINKFNGLPFEATEIIKAYKGLRRKNG